MAPRYKKGQTVSYKPIGDDSTGKITDVITEPGILADRNVEASSADPRYEIVNDNTGKATTIFECNIIGRA